jgi:hypothetical protein
MESKKESRRFPRVNFSGPLRFQVRGIPDVVDTVCENISLSGIRFINNSFVTPATPVMLEMNVLSRIIRPIAKVVWSQPFHRQDKFHLGAEFLEWDPGDKKFFSDYLSMKLKQP